MSLAPKRSIPWRSFVHWKKAGTVLLALSLTGVTAFAIAGDFDLVAVLHDPAAEHVDQSELHELVTAGHGEKAFELAFEVGDELFETRFNALDGGGANVGDGQRFTRIPRADLVGPGEWARHDPVRATGPNAESCVDCHNQPVADGAGPSAANVHRDPKHTGDLRSFIQRSTPHLFGGGAIQRLAEEMTEELQATLLDTMDLVRSTGVTTKVALLAKGISFGSIEVVLRSKDPYEMAIDTSGVRGVGRDLVVRPFQWKGSIASLRAFNRDACHNELGMQPTEITGYGVDGDGDGVVDEMSIGDITALTVYLAAQPRPTSLIELSSLGLLDPALNRLEIAEIQRGRNTFLDVGCAVCHVPQLKLDDPLFSEPSRNVKYRETIFPARQDALAAGVDPEYAVAFDLTADQPDNQLVGSDGRVIHFGALAKDRGGRAIVELFGDLKRHDMGPGLAENIDEVGTGASTFLTENLWGVGSTAPYLHDGRASTLTEAILEHGGEAQAARDAFTSLATSQQRDLIAFLENLVLFRLGQGDVVARARHRTQTH